MNDKISPLVSSTLTNSYVLAELIPKLAELDLLSAQDTQDIYSRAYNALEAERANIEDADLRAAYAESCRIVGEALNTTPLPDES
jgi:hypothetical protein